MNLLKPTIEAGRQNQQRHWGKQSHEILLQPRRTDKEPANRPAGHDAKSNVLVLRNILMTAEEGSLVLVGTTTA